MSTKIQSGNNTAGLVNVDSNYQLKVSLETDASNNPSNISGIKLFSENDDGTKTGTPYIASPETDNDYRSRTASDVILDNDTVGHVIKKSVNVNFKAIDFSEAAQRCLNYEQYIRSLAQLSAEELFYLGVCMYGPKKKVNKLTGSLPLLR